MVLCKGVAILWSFLCFSLPPVIAESSHTHGFLGQERAAPGQKRIHYITTMFNRAPLFDVCLASMTALARSDPDMSWIVVDYGTPGRDVKQLLGASGVPHQYFQVESEQFSRTLGLQRALEAVLEADGLVFSVDLIHVPLELPNRIRSNVVQGQKIFVPKMFSLEPGQAVGSSQGHWYQYSWGLIGFYKSDALRFGGYRGSNEGKIDLHKWGCEDVNFAAKFTELGFKAARMNVEGMQHVTLSAEHKSGLQQSLPKNMRSRAYSQGVNNNCVAAAVRAEQAAAATPVQAAIGQAQMLESDAYFIKELDAPPLESDA